MIQRASNMRAAKVPHLWFEKVTFLWFEFYSIVSEASQYSPVLNVVLKSPAEYKNIVKIMKHISRPVVLPGITPYTAETRLVGS